MKKDNKNIKTEKTMETDAMKRYMASISRYELLTSEDEVRLANIMRGNDPETKYKKIELKTTERNGGGMKRIVAIMMMVGAMMVGANGAVAQEDSKEPKELVSARATYQNSVKAVVTPLTTKYIQQLEQLKKQLGAKGDAEGAMVVQKEIESLSAEKTEVSVIGESGKGKSGIATKVLGRWMWAGVECEIKKDGTITGRAGTWKIEDGKLVITAKGMNHTLSFDGDGNLAGKRQDGSHVLLSKGNTDNKK
jgi:ABC-type glutathione transport system ATPase component